MKVSVTFPIFYRDDKKWTVTLTILFSDDIFTVTTESNLVFENYFLSVTLKDSLTFANVGFIWITL